MPVPFINENAYAFAQRGSRVFQHTIGDEHPNITLVHVNSLACTIANRRPLNTRIFTAPVEMQTHLAIPYLTVQQHRRRATLPLHARRAVPNGKTAHVRRCTRKQKPRRTVTEANVFQRRREATPNKQPHARITDLHVTVAMRSCVLTNAFPRRTARLCLARVKDNRRFLCPFYCSPRPKLQAMIAIHYNFHARLRRHRTVHNHRTNHMVGALRLGQCKRIVTPPERQNTSGSALTQEEVLGIDH